MPLSHANGFLGAPWFTHLSTTLSYPNRVIKFQHRGRDISIHANERGHSIPLVFLKYFNKATKKSIFSYMIYVKDSMSNNVQNSPLMFKLSQEELSHMAFLDEFASIFTDSIPRELPLSRGDDDHKSELIPRSSPPNKPP